MVEVEKLTTGDVYSNGMIPAGQPNLITGGIFIVYGVHAKEIISNGVVKTYGNNDMVLDIWGTVDEWTVKDEIISYGPSGIGFVNFGTVKNFKAEKSVKTFGLGARGFNQYDGTIEYASFKEIVTKGDGSIGMQFSKPVGTIIVEDGVKTNGSTGKTLVKGVIKELNADGISVVEGGKVEKLIVKGNIETHGEEVTALNIKGGKIEQIELNGELVADGTNSKRLSVEDSPEQNMEALKKYLE